ncbi:glycerol-3-phosphate responsive antiterminator GlpP [Vulcanibacillus modesticaldus]|uniref:Glycerol uptake operon antiterminator regulatory protein n=1 Tax=Vulcanibacillus modesticaldus TaxID=337097 RepID=A0A1D2YUM2_9BACI|nr:glycerol-3-phosphate responsive antiterminator [Vulcanibacillus modesticaldus]OEF99371.1 glycerol-3-phosphate responsive antiterminator GlpP [Vulcanibacillus modesticaldus]
MVFNGQKIIPAIRNMKNFEKALNTEHEYVILLDSNISQLKNIVNYLKKANKKIILHVDLIRGLKNDEHATLFLLNEIKPDGLISTRSQVITTAKKRGILSIQRLFLIDTSALEMNYKLIENVKPDFVEVLPGIIPSMISEIINKTGIPVLAGGLIRTPDEVNAAIDSGATAITTSNSSLW